MLKVYKTIWLTLLIIVFSSYQQLLANRLSSVLILNEKSDLGYLRSYKGRYPQKVKLLGNNPLTKRLKFLLKDKYNFLINNWGPEIPIELRKNTFIAWGCQQHNCSNTNFMIVVDLTKNVVYAGIREEEVIAIYSEDGSKNIEVTKWATRTN